jgi:hypothetical protein
MRSTVAGLTTTVTIACQTSNAANVHVAASRAEVRNIEPLCRRAPHKHDYIKNDFDVHEWAAPEFLEQTAKGLLEERWEKVTRDKPPDTTELWASTPQIG